MKIDLKKKMILTGSLAVITAAFIAAVFLNFIIPPLYSRPVDKTLYDSDTSLTVIQKGRNINIYRDEKAIWTLPENILAQDFLFEDIDHDNKKDLIVLCWKRGRFGKHRPTWVKYDMKNWSQHIYIYKVEEDLIRPLWMASDTGIKIRSWEYDNKILLITDTDGDVTKWGWIHWGLEKM